MIWTQKLIGAFLVFAFSSGMVHAQSSEEGTVESASEVLREVLAIPAKAIPASLLADSTGVVIIPGMIKGSFIVGVRHGKGVIVARNAAGDWRAPVFVKITGGSVGFQAGLQSTDVIAVFRNRQGVERLMQGKFTLGADASVAAGPIGRDASVATNGQLNAEIFSYSRSRGLFAGVAIDGAVIQVDHQANADYYAPQPAQPQGAVPGSAVKLVEQIAAYAGPKNKVVIELKDVPLSPSAARADQGEAARVQLAESSLRLHKVLDPQWREFLAIPREIYEGKTPSKEALAQCLDRYRIVSTEVRYRNLSDRPEFREAHALLLRYRDTLEGNTSGTLKLPPPPN